MLHVGSFLPNTRETLTINLTKVRDSELVASLARIFVHRHAALFDASGPVSCVDTAAWVLWTGCAQRRGARPERHGRQIVSPVCFRLARDCSDGRGRVRLQQLGYKISARR